MEKTLSIKNTFITFGMLLLVFVMAFAFVGCGGSGGGYTEQGSSGGNGGSTQPTLTKENYVSAINSVITRLNNAQAPIEDAVSVSASTEDYNQVSASSIESTVKNSLTFIKNIYQNSGYILATDMISFDLNASSSKTLMAKMRVYYQNGSILISLGLIDKNNQQKSTFSNFKAEIEYNQQTDKVGNFELTFFSEELTPTIILNKYKVVNSNVYELNSSSKTYTTESTNLVANEFSNFTNAIARDTAYNFTEEYKSAMGY